jgi:hypothetical protein
MTAGTLTICESKVSPSDHAVINGYLIMNL